MKYLDYNRTLSSDVDPALIRFLLAIFDEDILRRVRVAFPEYFTYERIDVEEVIFQDIVIRFKALKANPHFEEEGQEMLVATLDPFGLKLYSHEYRADGIKHDGYELLPQDFKLERDDEYNGLLTNDPWLVHLVTEDCPEGQEHLVIEILTTGDSIPEYFIFTVPTRNITF
jgi:hypothetical protein